MLGDFLLMYGSDVPLQTPLQVCCEVTLCTGETLDTFSGTTTLLLGIWMQQGSGVEVWIVFKRVFPQLSKIILVVLHLHLNDVHEQADLTLGIGLVTQVFRWLNF